MAGTIVKRGNKYRLQYMFQGNRYSRTIDTNDSKIAQIELARFIDEVDKGNFKNTNYTFFEFATIWMRDVISPNCSPITTQKHLGDLNNRIFPYIGAYKLTDINVMTMTNYINKIKEESTICKDKRISKPLSKATIEKYYGIISSCLNYAVECELISFNVCKKIKLSNKLKDLKSEINKGDLFDVYSEAEYKKVLELIKKEKLQNRCIIETALKTGCRRSEIFGLTYDDINFNNNTISINKSRHYVKGQGMIIKNCKNRSSIRTISIPESLSEILLNYKNMYPNNQYMFEGKSLNGICTFFKRFQEKNNIKVIRFHDMRHTHATLLLKKGIDLKTISERLGHASIKRTADTYIKFIKELDKTAANIIDEI